MKNSGEGLEKELEDFSDDTEEALKKLVNHSRIRDHSKEKTHKRGKPYDLYIPTRYGSYKTY